MPRHTWPSEWLRGTLTLMVLRTLADGPTYGYAIASHLEDAGFGTIKGGTLYPLLSRLETAGLVETEWRPGEGGPGRKYFALSAEGVAHLAEQTELWHAFTTRTTQLLQGGPR